MRNMERLDCTLAPPSEEYLPDQGKKATSNMDVISFGQSRSEELGYAGAVLGGGN